MIYKQKLITLMTIFSLMSVGWGQEVEWNQTLGQNSMGYFIEETSDSGFIITGLTYIGMNDLGSNNMDVLLIKIDSEGNEEWTKTFGEEGHDYGWCVRETSDGGFIITGQKGVINQWENYGEDLWLIKTDSEGNEEWTKTFGGDYTDIGREIIQTNDFGYVIMGYTSSFGSGGYDTWLIKTDSVGNEEWSNTFGGFENDQGLSFEKTSDEGYVITGNTRSFEDNINYDVSLIKTDSNGNQEWFNSYNGIDDPSNDSGHSVKETSDGGFIISGKTTSNDGGLWLIKTDSTGNLEWNNIIEDILYYNTSSILLIPNDKYMTLCGDGDLFIINSVGEIELIDNLPNIYPYHLDYTSDGSYISIGSTSPSWTGSISIIKFNLPLCNEETEVELWGECYNIEETTTLTPSNSQTSGQVIPPNIGNLINLEFLNLYNNQLTGDIPPEIGNLTNLWYLELHGNQLTGQIPSEIGNLVNLIFLHLDDNDLSGEIPGNICDLTIDWSGSPGLINGIPLRYFNVDNNNLCPPYPECLLGEDFLDENENGVWDEGEPFEDTNNNGYYEEDYVGYQDTSECIECSGGDLNSDTNVDILDILILVNCVIDGDCETCSDLNEDGNNDILDIVMLVNIILDN